MNACALWWGLPSRYGWAPDEIAPYVVQQGLQSHFSGDWYQPNYPPFHYYLLGLLHLPVMVLSGKAAVGFDSALVYTTLFTLQRLLSLVMAAAVLVLVHRLAAELYGGEAAVFAVLVAALCAPFVYYSKTANLEVPLTLWIVLSLYYLLRVVRDGRLRDYLLFTATAVAATCTKDQAFAFYVLPATFLLVKLYNEQKQRVGWASAWAPFTDRRVVSSVLLAFVAFFTLHNVAFNYSGFIHHLEGILWARGHYSKFEATPGDHLRMAWQSARHLGFAMGWPLTLCCLFGAGVALRERKHRPLPIWLLAAVVSYYVFFIAPVLSNYVRYLVPICVVLALFGGRVLAGLVERGARLYKLRCALVASVVAYSVLYAASVDTLMLNDSRYEVERWMAANVDTTAFVGYMGPEYYLPRLASYEAKRMRPTESVLNRERPDFLVINADYFQRFRPGEREGRLFRRLRAGRTGYALVYRYKARPRLVLLHFERILSNLGKINPLIEVYERVGRGAGERSTRNDGRATPILRSRSRVMMKSVARQGERRLP